MALFRCKMCGGELEIIEGSVVAECEFCGTKQTVPKFMDENMQNLFNRANTLRIKSEFDKAEKLYEKIIQADTTQSEAYWGLILCKYGIEYVDDPKTFKKIPTCHRASYDSIIADDDYKSAIENADISQRILYEEQAKEIDRIQREILALAQKEESYDVFICYKETDAEGKRTQDSVIANDIYYQLTQEGFKVFYAAITLEGKLGSAYEPIIFAALHSAKVMLAIGTRPEHFNAVWVKNEWSRYLKLIKKDRSRLLIPCYRDMDAYELPEEFAHLQAQDMSKIGFVNDVVRGIKKVVRTDEPKATAVLKETTVTSAPANIAPLLKRAFMFLEDGDFKSADEYCEKVLDQDPENAEAYLGKLLASMKLKNRNELGKTKKNFEESAFFQKAVLFGDAMLKSEMQGYLDGRKNRIIEEQRIAEEEKQKSAEAKERKKEERRKQIKAVLPRVLATIAVLAVVAIGIIFYKNVIAIFVKYNSANSLMKSEQYVDAIMTFENLGQYKDSEQKILECRYAIALDIQTEGGYEEAITAFEQLGDFKDSEQKALECKYAIAEELQANGQYEEAILAFEALETYEDSQQKIVETRYMEADYHRRERNFVKAAEIYVELGNYKNSKEMFESCYTAAIESFIDDNDCIGCYNALKSFGVTSKEVPLLEAYLAMGEGRYKDAIDLGATEIIIQKGRTHIKDNEFNGLSKIESVSIPNSVTSIGEGAFKYCTGLTSVTIPDSVTIIGDFAFYSCDSLTSVTIGNSVTSIGEGAFYHCYSLTSVTIGNSVTSIGSYAFHSCTSLKSVTIPNSVTSIGISAFEDCRNLTSITIPNSVTSIGDSAFCNCDSLTSVIIGNSVTIIGEGVFKNCTSLTSVTIPDSVKSIGYEAFSDCYSLTNVTIGNSVTSIGNRAFYYCDSLTSIIFEDTSTWYRTTSYSDWQNMTGGTKIDVTNSSTNATHFKSYDYYNRFYWYKK